MCNHEDRPCCGCLAEERATDYYDEAPEPYIYDEYDRYGFDDSDDGGCWDCGDPDTDHEGDCPTT